MFVFWINDEKVTFIVVWNTLWLVCYTIKESVHSVLVKYVKNNSNKKQVGIEYMYKNYTREMFYSIIFQVQIMDRKV